MFHFTHVKRSRLSFCGLAVLGLAATWPAQAQISVFSSGPYGVPENISVAPAGFGAHSGQLFIPDGSNNTIYTVPATGGAPTVFANPSILPTGITSGLFVPASLGGTAGGKYVAFGLIGYSSAVAANGAVTTFTGAGNVGAFGTALLAPAFFGAYSNQIIVMDQVYRQAIAINSAGIPTGGVSFGSNIAPFGSLLTPSGFGNVGGKILVDSNSGGDIVAFASNGTVTPFTSIPLKTGQVGLRQMTIAPAGFFPGVNQPLLLASIAGATNGGGTLGDVVALDSSGHIVESLRNNLGITALDPRGMYFLDSTHLLLSDASHTATRLNGQILELTSSAFAATTPEPGAIALFGALLSVGGCLRWRRVRRA